MPNWTATTWTQRADLDAKENSAVTIELTVGLDYAGDRFAVRRDRRVLNINAEWEVEPLPTSRKQPFFERCRFKTFQAAVDAAEKAGSKIR